MPSVQDGRTAASSSWRATVNFLTSVLVTDTLPSLHKHRQPLHFVPPKNAKPTA